MFYFVLVLRNKKLIALENEGFNATQLLIDMDMVYIKDNSTP